ncbi:chromosome segregation ATPase [Calothrix sp. UHCC 0171]|uniref:chromosome segregation ATPase n=1 Tax=Calothrix sp. UHCC 0171 TaxID=3110245 RepID=UPI002B1ED780|nr:chromosome segregation ATPase [Calothrix sp. UHCC 0171]MEA5570287.1 chromosome segregation ATPase [Calothrix sp. UHCC 0171]
MRERDVPEGFSSSTVGESDDATQLSRKQQVNGSNMSGVPGTNSSAKSTTKSVKQQKTSQSGKTVLQSEPQEPVSATSKSSGKLPRWTKSWILWTGLLAFVPGTIAFVSMAMLLKLPAAPNCPEIFWPLASASVRMHCAQLAASKQTVNDLLQAIELVKGLPENHPLRGEVDRLLEEWSKDVLTLADESFQAGKLNEAIATAKRIPSDMPAYKLVEEKIQNWQSIWTKGEEIYKETEDAMRNTRWQQAFMTASKLLRLDNKYWETIKYQQLNDLITKSREDGEKLAKAEDLAKTGVVDKIIEAIKLAESVSNDSYVYQKAQEAIPVFGRQMLNIAEKKLERRDADDAISIAQQIPINAGLQTETEDFIAIAEAQRNAWIGTVLGLESAIAQAQQIQPERAVYQKAQQLIAGWQLEIGDVVRLDKARMLASQGSIADLSAAVAEAQLVPANNPRSREARQEISRWIAQVQTIQDRPFLDRAEQLAYSQDNVSLQAAIAEASQIRRGRALYPEARKKISEWTAIIQRAQDQPYLDRARQLANNGDFAGAIQTASQITGNRALAGEAQSAINDWQVQVTSRDNWDKARAVALRGTPDALSEAMSIANKIPASSSLRNDVNPALDQWSQQLLDIARSQSESDINRAIQTAQLIPRGTAAYSQARQQIRAWREFLNPIPLPTEQAQPQPQESTTTEQ